MKFSGETFYSPSFYQGYISDSLELHLLVTRLERLRYFTILDSVYTTGFFPLFLSSRHNVYAFIFI